MLWFLIIIYHLFYLILLLDVLPMIHFNICFIRIEFGVYRLLFGMVSNGILEVLL
jgi:hypothetical protein